MVDDERAMACPGMPTMRPRVPREQTAYLISYGIRDVKYLWEFSEARGVYVDSIA